MSYLYVGDDGGTMMMETGSETTAGVSYEIHLERSTGNLYCTCPDAVCRRKVGNVLCPEDGCKHILGWHEHFRRQLR